MKYIALIGMIFGLMTYAQEKSIVIVIPSYNNAQWYKINLDSVCFQNYSNYRIIYIDDCSTDNTAQLVKNYIDEHSLHDKITLVCNKRRKGAMANHYHAVWMCEDDDIIVHVDGDDWLKHNDVLSVINNAYQSPDVWLTYGQFERYPGCQKGYCRPMPPAVIMRNAFREIDWLTSHLRTFYAGLFKQIKVRDFIYQDSFFKVTCDMAMFFPLLELAAHHIMCIEDILYVYNEETNTNDYKIFLLDQLHCDRVIRSRLKYHPVLDYHFKCEQPVIDAVIFFTGASFCKRLIEDLLQTSEVDVHITVVYKNQYLLNISKLEQIFTDVSFRYCKDDMELLVDELLQKPGYLLLFYDTMQIMRPLLLHEAVHALQQTHALAFHCAIDANVKEVNGLRRAQKTPPLIELTDNIYAWQYKYAEFDWKIPYGIGCLYPKSAVKKLIEGAVFNNVADYIHVLQSQLLDYDQVGLCFKSAPIRMCN